jgi:(p)ppGpp synthase/HD superfamily hydrolase
MTCINSRKVVEAMSFALVAHRGQKRKYTGEPYIVHPVAVAKLVATNGGTVNMICAALLHDTIEDTDVTHDDLDRTFGMDVANMVIDLTERDWDGNRAERKARECVRLSRVCASSQTIKVADLIDNTTSIVEGDPKFAKVYLKEKLALLKALDQADPGLKARAYEQIMDAQAKLLEES